MLSRSLLVPASTLLASLLFSPVSAQLTTDCNPLNATCPADAALGTAHTFYFNSTPKAGLFDTTAGTVNYNVDTGAAFIINKQKESPKITSNFYFFGGKTEVIMKAATGQGIISSIVWESDCLDEVDWEFMGGNSTHAETNYFGKGRQDFHNAIYHPVSGGVLDDYHNYTSVWTQDKLEWYIDGNLVRTLLPTDANSTNNYPQTPMKLSIGIWAGGDPDNGQGTIDWAGGVTDFTKAPFTMYVKSARVEDFSSGKEYSYGDMTGDWTSIKTVSGNSTAVENINAVDTESKSLSEKWDDLPASTKSGVYAGAAGVGAIMVVALVFYWFRQRQRGQREAALRDEQLEQERLELEKFKREGGNPDALGYEGIEYNSATMGKDGGIVNTSTYAVPNAERSNSLASNYAVPAQTAGWDPTSPAATTPAMIRSTMPLLQTNVPNSPRMGSPGPQAFNGPAHANTFGPSPMRSQSPGVASQFPPPSPGPRSYTVPDVQMRMNSPGPGYGNMVGSPVSMHAPERSFSVPPEQGYGNGRGYGANGGYHSVNNSFR